MLVESAVPDDAVSLACCVCIVSVESLNKYTYDVIANSSANVCVDLIFLK